MNPHIEKQLLKRQVFVNTLANLDPTGLGNPAQIRELIRKEQLDIKSDWAEAKKSRSNETKPCEFCGQLEFDCDCYKIGTGRPVKRPL